MRFVKWLMSHLIEGTVTSLASLTALASIYLFDNVIYKIGGVIGSFLVAYLVTYFFEKVRSRSK